MLVSPLLHGGARPNAKQLPHREAADEDFLAKDPARKVKVPAQLSETDKTTLTWDHLRKALSGLDDRDRLLFELDMAMHSVPASCLGSGGSASTKLLPP